MPHPMYCFYCRTANAPVRVVPMVAAAALLIGFGCRPADEIRSYTVPEPQTSAASDTPADNATTSGEPTHRMLGMIAKGGDQAWFFKLVGTTDEVAKVADSVNEFLTSIEMGEKRPTWTLPEGWKEKPSGGMRLATLTVADGLEISVIGLGLSGDWDAQLLNNVNRWRGQLALPHTGQPGLASSTKPVEGLEDAVLVDLAGRFKDTMSAPFAGGGGGRPPMARPTPPPAPRRPATTDIAFDTPIGWQDLGATSMRQANLSAGDEAEAVSIRASRWNAFGQMGDPTANVNRWRSQVGLLPVEAAQVAELAQPVTIAGESAVLFEMMPDEAANTDKPMAMLAAMLKRGEQVWFFLMSGPPKTVAAERANYDAWLASVRFGDQANKTGEE